MKIIEATWEKRNFGMDTYEISLDKKDLRNFDDAYQKIKSQNFKNSYVVIKMPVGNLEALHKLEDDGYRFLETQLSLVDHFEPLNSEIESLPTNNLNYSVEKIKKDKNLWTHYINKITPGMFDTDRVSLDPKLGKEIACKRYKNWCLDLFENPNANLYIKKINNAEFGFFIDIVDEKTGNTNSIIGGNFEEFKNMGLGSVMLAEAKNLKANRKTAVSTNNLPILKLHQHCGRVIYKERYVLRKIYE